MKLKEEIKELFKALTQEEIKLNLNEILRRVDQASVYKIKDLITDNGCDCVPKNEPGVYFVGRADRYKLTLCTAKELKYGDVRGDWYDNEFDSLINKLAISQYILYIGKANNLKKRVNQYMDFVGETVNKKRLKAKHLGGRAICHIKEVCELNFCWISLKDLGLIAENVESALLIKYKESHGNYPFANWRA